VVTSGYRRISWLLDVSSSSTTTITERQESPAGNVKLLARSIRGLERIVAAELIARFDAEISEVGHREIRFRAPLTRAILDTRSADDIFLECGIVEGVPHTRDGLAMLSRAVQRLPLRDTIARARWVQSMQKPRDMEVIASFLGARNYSRLEIEDEVGSSIAQKTGLRYRSHEPRVGPGADISWRVHIRDGQAFIGLRLSSQPLHRRSYKLASRTGSLHPPVAFAMAILADISPGMVCLDPFCGVGTILVEAHALDSTAFLIGSDLEFEALIGARENAVRAECPLHVIGADAGRLPYASGSVDRIITNVPWGNVVEARGLITQNRTLFFNEVARVLAATGSAVLLGPVGDSVDIPHLRLVWENRLRISGKWAAIRILTRRSIT
jgi:tRNA (guanine6-N2)-methyltransferase